MRRPTALVSTIGVALIAAGAIATIRAQSPTPSPQLLSRRYREGERLSYRMTARNTDRSRTIVYSATARGLVKRDNAGRFFEEYEWSDIVWDGAAVSLPQASREFRQVLSLSADYTPSLPDFSRIDARLIGPSADLMTFYSDVWLAMRQPDLRQPGDRAMVNHDQPNSWADGTRVLIGEDAINFVIVLGEVATARGLVNLTVQHVPPLEPKIKIPVGWMQTPLTDVANNWVEVARTGNRYVASIGNETFEAKIQLALADGKIVSAHLENPVDVFERECTNELLTECGEGLRYPILRQIDIVAMP